MIRRMSKPPESGISSRDMFYNKWYKNEAWETMQGNYTVVYEYVDGANVLGFATASMNAVKIRTYEKPFKIPAVLLGKIAVNDTQIAKDKKVAKKLIGHVVKLANEAKQKIGCRIVMVHVQHKNGVPNDKLIEYYENFGFEECQRTKRYVTLFFDLHDIGQ